MASSKPSANMLGGGRFTRGLNSLLVAYNESIYSNRAIYALDIRGGITYARDKSKIGILTPDEFVAIEGSSRWKRSGKAVNSKSSHIHTANKHRLGETTGTGIVGKLYTGRSRNGRVGTSVRPSCGINSEILTNTLSRSGESSLLEFRVRST
jgi:argininosuccinate lyase